MNTTALFLPASCNFDLAALNKRNFRAGHTKRL
jgi:hypothetical protein